MCRVVVKQTARANSKSSSDMRWGDKIRPVIFIVLFWIVWGAVITYRVLVYNVRVMSCRLSCDAGVRRLRSIVLDVSPGLFVCCRVLCLLQSEARFRAQAEEWVRCALTQQPLGATCDTVRERFPSRLCM